MVDMSHTRVRTVVNVYDTQTVEAQDSDSFIEERFTEAVNQALREVEELGGEVVSVFTDHKLSNTVYIMTATIEYGIANPVDDIEEDEVPELGPHPRKVNEEVFDFVKEKAEEDMTPGEIADLFQGGLSTYTVQKILKTKKYSDYYALLH